MQRATTGVPARHLYRHHKIVFDHLINSMGDGRSNKSTYFYCQSWRVRQWKDLLEGRTAARKSLDTISFPFLFMTLGDGGEGLTNRQTETFYWRDSHAEKPTKFLSYKKNERQMKNCIHTHTHICIYTNIYTIVYMYLYVYYIYTVLYFILHI